jgi:hypothetical protein
MRKLPTVVARALPIVLMFVASAVEGQTNDATSRDAHRWALALAVDAGTLPNDFSERCGKGEPTLAIGGGVAALFRPRSILVLEGEVRASGTIPMPFDCNVGMVLPPGATIDDLFPKTVPRTPLVRSALRVGVETPRGYPLVRATIGGGMIVAFGQAPYRTTAIGFGTRSDGARVYVELENSVTRVRRNVVRWTSLSDSGRLILESAVLHPSWTSLRARVEVPL